MQPQRAQRFSTLHELRAYDVDSRGPASVSVGWDNDRATFFAQVRLVYPNTDGTDAVFEPVRLGVTPHEVHTARAAIDAIRGWAEVPADLEDLLDVETGPPDQRVATVHTPNDDRWLWSEGVMTVWSELEPQSASSMNALPNTNSEDEAIRWEEPDPQPDHLDLSLGSSAHKAFRPLANLDAAGTLPPDHGAQAPARGPEGPRR